MRVSNSEIRTFKRCRRKYWLTYIRRLRRVREPYTGAAKLGTRVHLALHAHYTGGDAIQALVDLFQRELKEVPEYSEDITKENDMALAIVEGYLQWLEEEGADEDIEVIGAEQPLETQSPVPGVSLVGRLDLNIRRRSTGETGFLDHKTVASLTEPLKMLNLDEQFRQYALMKRLIAPDEWPPTFTIYSMLKKSKRTARAKPPFYARYEVYISEADLRAFWNRLYGEIHDIITLGQRLAAGEHHRVVAYPTPDMSCTWQCEFYPVCPMFDDDASDPESLIESLYEPHDPHDRYADLDENDSDGGTVTATATAGQA